MSRPTLDIDPSDALAHGKPATPPPAPWITKPMRSKVDLDDKDALYAALGEQ